MTVIGSEKRVPESLDGHAAHGERETRSWLGLLALTALVLTATLAGTILIVLNPAKYWDDWVWAFKTPEEFIRIGIEMGVWWSGYLSAAIYSMPDPVLPMRILALVSWIIAAGAFAIVAVRMGLISRSIALILFLVIASTHVAPIRFVVSASMYNVYIATFWVACAIVITMPRSRLAHLFAVILFLFSFHLNSILVLYLLFLAWRLFTVPIRLASVEEPVVVPRLFTSGDLRRRVLSAVRERPVASAWSLIRAHFLFLVLPVLFILVVKVPSLIMVTADAGATNIYAGYNAVRPGAVIAAIGQTIASALPMLGAYVAIPWDRGAPLIIFGVFFILIPLLAFAVRRVERPRLSTAAKTAGVGLLLLLASLYPYYVVNKPPLLEDFYESRHGLMAVPGIALVAVAILQLLLAITPAKAHFGRLAIHHVSVAALLALSISFSFVSSIYLLRDWTREAAIIDYVERNSDAIEDFPTIIFDDRTEGFLIGYRYIWNYEYTGYLVEALDRKTHLGISLGEYAGLPANTALIHEPFFRQRYNLDDYEFRGPGLMLTIENGLHSIDGRSVRHSPLSSIRSIELLASYWLSLDFSERLRDLFEFTPSVEFIEADRRMKDMAEIVDALKAYQAENGYYPLSVTTHPPKSTAFGTLPQQAFSSPYKGLDYTWKSELAPEFIAKNKLTTDCDVPECGYLYLSDGVSYKLVYKNPQDLPYARQAYGDHIDGRREGYGYWTEGAANW